MSQPSGTLGARLYISDAPIAATIDDEAAFSALSWVEVGLIESFGEFGRVFDLVTFQQIRDGRTFKLKGGYNEGSIQFTLGQDLSDAGQALVKTAANGSNQDNYGFRIALNDPPSSIGGPSLFYFRGLVMSFRTQMGAANVVVRCTPQIEVNSPILNAAPAALYDRFMNGGPLTAYALFKGSDAQAALPAITGNALAVVTGDAGTGYAADGSQAIAQGGFTLSNGPLVVETRLKASAITDVALFVGLTDQKAALEAPVESAASTDDVTTNAGDAVGFMFDTAMATDNIWLVGVNNGSDDTPQDAGIAFAADTYKTLRIEVADDGAATFYIDGAIVGTVMAAAVATGVPLYPTICAAARSTASRTITVDELYVRQN